SPPEKRSSARTRACQPDSRYTLRMDWDRRYESPDVEDRRGQRAPMAAGDGGLGMLIPLMFRFGWRGGLVIALLYAGAGFLFGLGAPHSSQRAGHDDARAFVGFVLDDVQRSWAERMPGYQRAHVVLYSDATSTGCGLGEAAVGPFYCPRDERVYLD